MTWPTVTLDELQAPEPRSITDGPFGSNLARKHYTSAGPRVVRLQNIGDGAFIDAKAHISEDHFESLRAHEVRAGDLLVASLGEVLPRACLAPSWLGPAIVKADCIRVRLREDVDPRWVMYALQRPAARQWANDHRHGVGRPRLGLRMIRQIPVPRPAMKEQRRIVDLLEDHLSHLHAAADALLLARHRVDAWRSSLVDSLVWAPAWPSHPIGELLREPMRNGRSDRAATGSQAGIRTLTLTAVTRNQFVDAHTKMTTTPLSVAKDLWLEPGDIFVQRANTPELVGTAAQFNGASAWAIFPDLLIRVRPDDRRMSSGFLTAVLRSERAHRTLRARAKGLAGSMPKIDQAAVASVRVPIPTLDEQNRVLAVLSEADMAVERATLAIEGQLSRAEVLRTALLTAAFTGRLAPTSGALQEETADA